MCYNWFHVIKKKEIIPVDSKIIPFQGFQSFFYNRRYFLNFRWYLKKIGQGSGARLRAPVGPGQSPAGAKLPGSSWNLAFCGPKKVLQRLQIIKWFWKKNPINFLFRVQISPVPKYWASEYLRGLTVHQTEASTQ
jgi:hypothetical protein